MLQALEEKLKDLGAKLEQSLQNHNFLLGAKAALEQVYTDAKAALPAVEGAVELIDPAAMPVITEVNEVVNEL